VSTSTAPSVRCPACTAYVRAGSEWCTLCYADLRPKPDPTPADSHEVAPEAVADTSAEVENVGTPVADVPELAAPKPRGKHAKQATGAAEARVFAQPTQAVADAEIDAIADRMLAELATQRENPLGPLSGWVDTKGKQAAVMVGGAIAAMCVIFVLMALAGTFV
jgi:hypothetical protein